MFDPAALQNLLREAGLVAVRATDRSLSITGTSKSATYSTGITSCWLKTPLIVTWIVRLPLAAPGGITRLI